MTCDRRDKAYPEFNEAGNPSVARFVDTTAEPNPRFLACDEWVYIYRTTGNPAVPIAVVDQFNQVYNVDEPFFVSGKLELTVSSTAGFVAFMKAPRRELLSWVKTNHVGASNDPVQSVLYSQAFTAPAVGVNTNWAYLDENLTWQIAAIGQTPGGMPFGANSPIPADRRGRYYNVEYATQDNGNGLTQVHIVYPSNPTGLRTSGYGFAISPNQAAMAGVCSIGDESFASDLSDAPAGVGLISNMKGARAWTIAISVAVAGATGPGGFLHVVRRGF